MKSALDHVGESLEPAVRMHREARGLPNVEVVEQDEGVEVAQLLGGEETSDGRAVSLELGLGLDHEPQGGGPRRFFRAGVRCSCSRSAGPVRIGTRWRAASGRCSQGKKPAKGCPSMDL